MQVFIDQKNRPNNVKTAQVLNIDKYNSINEQKN